MALLKFYKIGLLTTIQDCGRKGLAYYGIPASGVMDAFSAQEANILIDNPIKNPVLECHMVAPEIQFDSKTSISITGANMLWKVNGAECKMNQIIFIQKGDILSGSYSIDGLRAYIAIKGRPKTQKSFGSFSSYTYAHLGANHGRNLSKGDTLEWNSKSTDIQELKTTIEVSIKRSFVQESIPIFKGPEYNMLDDYSKELLTNSSFSVTTQSNRMGARLLGPQLKSSLEFIDSKAILPGFIQLLPSGQMIVILQDGQTTGGYPRIAYISENAMNIFNQIAFNKPFNFSIS